MFHRNQNEKENYNTNNNYSKFNNEYNKGCNYDNNNFGGNGFEQYNQSPPVFFDNPKNVRHSNMAENFSVSYIEFSDIPSIPSNTDIYSLFEKIKMKITSKHWLDSFYALNDLRSLNKSFPSYINEIFVMFGEDIKRISNSMKPCLNKNLLAFFNEVLMSSQNSSIDMNIIINFIPILIRKINTPNKAIKEMAEICLNVLVENCSCEEIIKEFCTFAVNDNINIGKIAFHALGKILDDLKEKIANLNEDCFRIVFMTLSFNLKSKSTNNKILARNVILFIEQLMTEVNFKNYLDFLNKNGWISRSDGLNIIKVVYKKENNFVHLSQRLIKRRSEIPYVNPKGNKFYMNG